MKCLLIALGLFVSTLGWPTHVRADSLVANASELRAIEMANRAIFAAIMIPKTESGMYLCAREKVACAGVNQGELGVMLLASGDSGLRIISLISAIRFATDAGLSELLACKIGEKGRDALKHFNALSVEGLRNECESNFASYRRPGSVFSSLEVNDACRTPEQLRVKLDEVKELLKSGETCE